jgi:hypothetical protein
MKTPNMRRLIPLIPLLSFALVARVAADTIQVDLGPLLNARIVTTLTAGKLVTWTDALDAITSGEATRAAALAMGEPFADALPDDGVFAANARHPLIRLSFSNAEPVAKQVRRSKGEDDFVISVPAAHYTQFWIVVMSGYGDSTLKLQLRYADGHAETQDLHVPDWYFPLKEGDPRGVNLAVNMGKWSSSNHLMEKDHHYLHAFDLAPDPKRMLVSVELSKTAKAVLTLWGATGVTTAH